MANFRIDAASSAINGFGVTSLLDVGCRGCELQKAISEKIDYFGNDLFQNNAESVAYVGDFMDLQFDRKFECCVALDVVEHVDDPHALVARLFSLSEKYVVISLPNIFSLTHKRDFLFSNTLGAKYAFRSENSLDRHRWVMSYEEIHAFFKHCEKLYDAKCVTRDLMFGSVTENGLKRAFVKCARPIFGQANMTKAVLAVFEK